MAKKTLPSSQINRLESLYKNVLASGHSVAQLKEMNLSEYNKALNKNLKSVNSLKAQKRLLKQVDYNIEAVEKRYIEKRQIKDEFFIKAVKELGKQKFGIVKFESVISTSVEKARLTTFEKMTQDLQAKHGISERKAILRSRALLKVPRKDFKKLNRTDRDVLIHYGY